MSEPPIAKYKRPTYTVCLPNNAYRHVLSPPPWRSVYTYPLDTTNEGLPMTTEILDLHELATLLGRSPETIKNHMSRNHLTVPPRLHIPGTRLLRWRQVDVTAWLASYVEQRDVKGRDDQQEGGSK